MAKITKHAPMKKRTVRKQRVITDETRTLLSKAVRSKISSDLSLWDYYVVNAPPVPKWYWTNKSDLVDDTGRFPDLDDFIYEVNPNLINELRRWQSNYDKQTKWFTWSKDTPEWIISTYNQLFKEYNHYNLLVSIDNSQFEKERFFMWVVTYAVEMLVKREGLVSNSGNPLNTVSGNSAKMFISDLKESYKQ